MHCCELYITAGIIKNTPLGDFIFCCSHNTFRVISRDGSAEYTFSCDGSDEQLKLWTSAIVSNVMKVNKTYVSLLLSETMTDYNVCE